MDTSQDIVIDSSVIIKWLNHTDEENLKQAAKLLDDVEKNSLRIALPHLAQFEIGNALLKGKKLTIPKAEDAFNALGNLPISYYGFDEHLLGRAFAIANRLNTTFYDACFVCLAQKLRCPLITANPKHQKSIPGVTVIALEEYV